MTREQWLKERGNRIGGSNISAVLGLNPYQSPYDLWLRLTGREEPPAENNHMIAGRFLENAVAEWFDYETPHHVVKASAKNLLFEHPEHKFLVASPDRKVYLDGSRKKENTVLAEIKTTGRNIDPDSIPPEWFIQPTYYCGILGYKRFIVIWYDRHRNNIDFKLYDFDKELYDYIIEKAVFFWNEYVVKDKRPPAETSSDIIKIYPNHEEGKTIVATDEVLELYGKAIELKRKEKIIKNVYNDTATQIKLIMKDAERLVTPQLETLFTFKTNKKGSRILLIKEI